MNDRPRDLDAREQQRLRDLLDDATSDVHPHDGLDAIRSRTKVSPMSTRPWMLGAAAAVLATAATVTAVAVLGRRYAAGRSRPGCRPVHDRRSPRPPPRRRTTPATSRPTPPTARSRWKGPSPSTTSATPARARASTASSTPGSAGPPSTRPSPTPSAGRPTTPTTATRGPPAPSITGTVTDGKITLALTGPDGVDLSQRPDGMSRDEARIAVQQLVYTAQAALQTSTAVSFSIDGEPAQTLLNVAVDEPLARGAEDGDARAGVDHRAGRGRIGRERLRGLRRRQLLRGQRRLGAAPRWRRTARWWPRTARTDR